MNRVKSRIPSSPPFPGAGRERNVKLSLPSRMHTSWSPMKTFLSPRRTRLRQYALSFARSPAAMWHHWYSAVRARWGDGGLGIAGSTSSNAGPNDHTNRSNTGLRVPSVFVL